jgi:ABC-type uncharacterized transport system permease subunit
VETVIASATTAAVPLLLASLAVLIASRAGVLNLAAEGMMLGAAFLAAWVAAASGGGVGFAVAVLSGGVAGLVLGWLMVTLRADQVVVGVAYNIMILGLTAYAAGVITKTSRSALDVGTPAKVKIPGLADIPGIGVLFDQNWIAYLAFILVPITSYVLFRTGLGTRLRACGEYAEGARAVGIKVVRVRVLAMGVSGALAAMAGAYLVLGDLGLFRRNLSGGRGYIAFVIVILARYRPLGALLAAAGFGLCQALTFYLQLKGVHIPSQFILATPYVVTLLAIVLLGKRIGQPPAEEGRPLQITR